MMKKKELEVDGDGNVDKKTQEERSTTSLDASTLHKTVVTTGRIDDTALEEVKDEPLDKEALPDQPESLKKEMSAHRFGRFFATKKGKVVTILGMLAIIILALFSFPATRYGIMGTFMKKNVHVVIVDSITQKPVSQVAISLGSHKAITGANGEVDISNVPVGEYTIKLDKKYYKEETSSYVVPILSDAKDIHETLQATGRQVTVHIVNKISQAVLAKAVLSVSGTSATTDDKGNTTIVLPADQKSINGSITLAGYNEAKVAFQVTDKADANNFSLVPSGSLYYLSKATGTIDVMKSDLDGANASVVVPGKGTESDTSTTLLATQDWKYLVLSANRDPSQEGQLYLVNTDTGKLTTIDEGTKATFQLVGWSGHRFIYLVNREQSPWLPKGESLESFDADTGTITTLDETRAAGVNQYNYSTEQLQNISITEGKVVYAKYWYTSISQIDQNASGILTVNPDGTQPQRIKELGLHHNVQIDSRPYDPGGIYFNVYTSDYGTDSTQTIYTYEDNAIKTSSITLDTFNSTQYPTYLLSPSGQKTLWYEPRDGKNTIFVGDKDAKNPITLANESDFTVYGWYGESYVLLSKGGSELYIAPATAGYGGVAPTKVTNYHKPAVSLYGYGTGYGGAY